MNDAGTVIVADVYAAGEQPIPGMTRDALVEGLRARGHRSVVALPNPGRLPEMVHAIARSGDFRRLPRRGVDYPVGGDTAERSGGPAGRQRQAGGGDMMAAAPVPTFAESLPPLRGRVQTEAPLGPFTWFRAGGAAEVLVRPADADDLAAFLCALPHEVPGARDRRMFQPDHTGWWTAWRHDSAGSGGSRALRPRPTALSPVRRRWMPRSPEYAAAAGLTGLEFLSGVPGSLGGAVAMNAGAFGGDMATVLDWG